MEVSQHVLEDLKTEFFSAMQLSQKEFEQEVQSIETEITEFGQYQVPSPTTPYNFDDNGSFFLCLNRGPLFIILSISQDIAKIKIVSEKVRKIDLRLKDCNARVMGFNKNEMLFGCQDATDYKRCVSCKHVNLFSLHSCVYSYIYFPSVTRISKAFEPYSVLWSTTDNWLKWSKSWMNDSLMSLDPNEIRNNVENSQRLMV